MLSANPGLHGLRHSQDQLQKNPESRHILFRLYPLFKFRGHGLLCFSSVLLCLFPQIETSRHVSFSLSYSMRLSLAVTLISVLGLAAGFLEVAAFSRTTQLVRCESPRSVADAVRNTRLCAALQSGDGVLVIGGTGGVGQLVTQKLAAAAYDVRVASRDPARAAAVLANDNVRVVSLDLLSATPADLDAALQGTAAVVISVGTTAFPTMKWRGGNTPQAIDQEAVTNIAQSARTVPGLKKVVLLTSVGVDRTGEMPFLILNLFGVLDAKKAGEQAVVDAAVHSGFEYAIIRPGRLVGGPYTNPDVAKLLQVQGGAENGVDVQPGDSLLGDCKRDACAEAVVQCLINEECRNVDFSIASNDQPALTNEAWNQAFRSMTR
jgi:uncharacterized protein YbjT (DUF2867 family)